MNLVESEALAQILLIESLVGELPSKEAMLGFVCRGLERIPGVLRVSSSDGSGERVPANEEKGGFRLPLLFHDQLHATLHFQIFDEDRFSPYAPYLKNLAFMVGVVLAERQQRAENERYRAQLESLVEDRTRELRESVQQTERARQRAERYLEVAEAFIVELDASGRIVVINKLGCEILAIAPGDAEGKDWFDLAIPADQRDRSRSIFQRLISGNSGLARHYFENDVVSSEGNTFCISWHNEAVLAPDGRIIGTISSGNDMSERKRAEKERQKLSDQLAEAQKLESIGRLAGGVAHDFNNKLCVIIGHAELALEQLDPTQDIFSDLEEIRKAAECSADLTRQLLSFARRQAVVPEVLELNKTISSTLRMLKRTIGENIALEFNPADLLLHVRIDKSQVDQVLTNLCINARDAISGVGRILIGSAAVDSAEVKSFDGIGPSTGSYIILSVSDNGCGIPKAVLAHIFEPFFTTKGLGSGTGLGLASVFGIVKQNHGFIDVSSEPGRGSSFQIFLPAHSGSIPQSVDSRPRTYGRQCATLLLVEDEAATLELAKRILEREGFTVLAASCPSQAIQIARDYPSEIHLLVTDIIMPEMNGRQLADRILSVRPNLAQVFISGYPMDSEASQRIVEDGGSFLHKPFSARQLTSLVIDALQEVVTRDVSV